MPALGPFLRSRAPIGVGVASVVAMGGVGSLPLFAGPGYEAALAAGLLLPAVVAVATSVEVGRARVEPLPALARGFGMGLWAALLGYLVTMLHGLRVGFCDPFEGSLLFWLGGGAGAVAGGTWGAMVGVASASGARARVGIAVSGALAGPLLGIAVSLLRFYASPMVFAFDPFFGYFAGPLYDTEIDGVGRLATYRVGTVLALAGIAAFASILRPSGRGLIVSGVGSPWKPLIGAVALTGALAHAVFGDRLGHWSTSTSIERVLGEKLGGDRCELIHSPALDPPGARRLLRECEAHVPEIEAFLGTHGPERTRVFVFDSAATKGRLMGASRTQIAKPWRAEIYLTQAPYPHPVLRHELAHVVAGAFGAGPFRIAGPWGGLLPDPGRIEGVAEAAAPDDDADLTLRQWARAMRDLGQLPPLANVFRLGFLRYGAARAYTVAGAFVEWLIETRGAESLRRWYSGESLEVVTGGVGLAALEQEWVRSLDGVSIPARALPAARARFDRPAIFGRRCPRIVDRLDRLAAEALLGGRPDRARETYAGLLRLDPAHVPARLGLGTCALREGDAAAAAALLEGAAEDPGLGAFERGAARERRGDLHLLAGEVARARAAFDAAAESVIDSGRLRALELKRTLAEDPEARAALVELLVGARDRGPDFALAAARLGEWAGQRPDDGTPLYLLAKNLYGRGRFTEAADYLDRALTRSLLLPSLREEAWRVRLLAACAIEDLPAARRAYAAYTGLLTPSEARRAGTYAVARRCGAAR
ncbi:MAG: hypothetical protein JW751_03820 [Polyangiaceae bacterium]|nr:hypothetical protein [Polyangiaceae bacterium]